MPKIQQYVSRVQSPGAVDLPRANVETMGAEIGRGYEKLGAAVSGIGGEIQRANEQSEISDLGAKMAQTRAELTIELKEKVRSGNVPVDENGDYNLTEEFRTKISERMDNLRQGIKTRKGELAFNEDSAQLMGQFTVSVSEAQSQLVGAKASNDYLEAFKSRSSTLLNNPSSFTDVLAENDKDILRRVESGQLPALEGEDLRAKGSKQLAKAYVEGFARLDPNSAKQILDSGRVDAFMDGDTKLEMYAKVRAEERAMRTEENLLKVQEKEAYEQNTQKFLDTVYSDVAKGKSAGFRRRINDADIPYQDKVRMINILEAQTTKPVKTNNSVYISLLDRIMAPDGTPGKITSDKQLNEYALNGSLSLPDLNRLRKQVNSPNTAEGKAETALKNSFLQSIKKNLIGRDPLTGMEDPDGNENYVNFLSTFEAEYAKGLEAGKSPAQMLTTTSPDYLGKAADRFYKSPQQLMQAQIQRHRPVPVGTPPPNAPKRNAGESAADFLKRVKGSK